MDSFDFNSFPKGHHPFDIVRSLLRGRIDPASIRILFAVDDDIVVDAVALPWTGGGRLFLTRLEVLLLPGISWEVVIAFHDHRFV